MCHAYKEVFPRSARVVRESSNGRTAAFEAVNGGSNPPTRSITLSSKGRTAGSEPVNLGSNPSEVADELPSRMVGLRDDVGDDRPRSHHPVGLRAGTVEVVSWTR